MDTKSKSVKPSLAFLAFFLGINLLLLGLVALGSAVRGIGWQQMADAFQSDYQDTLQFRQTMEGWFQRICDGDLVEGDLLTDNNLLYYITRTGEAPVTNEPTLASDTLPEGYNFLLTFDGYSVTIQKDGQTVDVYGDGTYRDDSQWFLPGYQNYPVPSRWYGLTFTLAAAKDPAPYILEEDFSATPTANTPTPSPQSSQSPAAEVAVVSRNQYSSGLYNVTRSLERYRVVLVAFVILPLSAGAVLFLWYILWRKHKAAADRAIARLTGCLWPEIKIVLFFPYCALAFFALYVTAWLILGRGFSDLVPYLLVPAALWLGYLYVNDLRYNFGTMKAKSPLVALSRAVRARELRYPVGQRLCRRGALQFLLCVPFFLFCALAALLLFGFWINSLPILLLMLVVVGAGVALIVLQLRLMAQNRQAAADLDLLLDRVLAVGTDQASHTPLPADSDLRAAADSLDQMETRLRQAVEEQVKSEKLKLELITNVSHDLKTPLTSMVSYLELLRQEEELPDHVKDYLQVLDQKTRRLQAMVLDVFDVSKAATGNLKTDVKPIDFTKLLRQTLADQDEAISASRLTFRMDLPREPVYILADGDRLYRVFQNLVQNALKYALEGSRVYLSLTVSGNTATAALSNTSREELPQEVDLTERFVRGDQSRTDGGSGLGLSIARTFTEACGGAFTVSTQADLFTAQVSFPLTARRPEEDTE